MANLLFEIGTEEIPAKFMPPALKQLKELAKKALEEHRLNYKELNTYGTPRRFVLEVKDLDMLYAMSIGTWKMGIKSRNEKIDQSNLPTEEKTRLKKVLNQIQENAENNQYLNLLPYYSQASILEQSLSLQHIWYFQYL